VPFHLRSGRHAVPGTRDVEHGLVCTVPGQATGAEGFEIELTVANEAKP